MKANILRKICNLKENKTPLEIADLPDPVPGKNEILIKVSACGVCHTELDEIEGRTPPSYLPIVPGHQVVGKVKAMGKEAKKFKTEDRVGVAWIYSACGKCNFCIQGHENLCPDFMATGRDADGGYAQYMAVPEAFAFRIPDAFSDCEAAPLLCAGAVGYRSMMLAGLQDGQNLGLTGFGASAHLVLKMAIYRYPNLKIFVSARSHKERLFARELGAFWSGDTAEKSPETLNAVIDTTPAWKPVVEAMQNLTPGGRLVINAIRKENADKNYLLHLDYSTHIWMEKEIKSVANVTRSDVIEFLELAAEMKIKPEIREFPLEAANTALVELKTGNIRGAKVLKIE